MANGPGSPSNSEWDRRVSGHKDEEVSPAGPLLVVGYLPVPPSHHGMSWWGKGASGPAGMESISQIRSFVAGVGWWGRISIFLLSLGHSSISCQEMGISGPAGKESTCLNCLLLVEFQIDPLCRWH